jgi:hypothetical protein
MSVLLPRCRQNDFGLGYSPFDRHYSGNHSCFLLLRVLRCFSSPGSLSDCSEYHAFSVVGCPIRIPTDQRLFAPPRRFSQLITSFFASGSLGIHRMPLLTFFTTIYLVLINIFFQYVKELLSAATLVKMDFSISRWLFWISTLSLKLRCTQRSFWTRTNK